MTSTGTTTMPCTPISCHSPPDADQTRRWWATAAYYGYRAYDDSGLLANAVATWNHVTQYVITAADASAGSIATKDFAIAGTCNGKTMAGGVFWRPTDDDTNINSITTGLYIALSAFLAEATGDASYTDAAILSANWIRNQNLNTDYLVLDTVQGNDCSTSPATELFTYNSGKYIEGLAVLAAVTGDSQWSDLYTNIVNAAVKTTVWEGANGVITEGADTTANNDGVGFKCRLLIVYSFSEPILTSPSHSCAPARDPRGL